MTRAYKEIAVCRLSGSPNLISVLNLGQQALTGIFPRSRDEAVTAGPLELVWCADSGLLQLRHSYSPQEMYGDNYGYRSGLNQSMVSHLAHKASFLERLAQVGSGDVVLDIGSNDSTLLRSYSRANLRKIGIDPTGSKFREYYPEDVFLVPEFFWVRLDLSRRDQAAAA